MGINAIMATLVEELVAGGMADPLGEPLTLAALWADVARIGGEPLPEQAELPMHPWTTLPDRQQPIIGCQPGERVANS